jgi:hypothetical protein
MFLLNLILFQTGHSRGDQGGVVLSLEGRIPLRDGGVIGFYIPEPSCML